MLNRLGLWTCEDNWGHVRTKRVRQCCNFVSWMRSLGLGTGEARSSAPARHVARRVRPT